MTQPPRTSRSLLSATALSALVAGAAVEAQDRASVAPKNMQAITPALADYTDKVLFGDVWVRTELSPRDRSLVTVSVLISTGKTPQLPGHLNRALTNGLKPTEIAGMVTHLAFYSGWPNAVSALNVVEQVFTERKIDVADLQQSRAERSASTTSESPRTAIRQGALFAPKFTQLTNDVLSDLWRRSDLTSRDRSLVTIVTLAANGDDDQLVAHVRLGLENGLTRNQIGEALTHLAFYAGWPKAVAAIAVAGSVLGAAAVSDDAAATHRVIVTKPNTQPQTAPASNFTGAVSVASPFKGTGDARLGGATVTFQPGARTHWHSHPLGQLLVVMDGQGWVQAEGEPVRIINPGDVVWSAPGAKHWHGATATKPMTHIAVSETQEGATVTWLEPVSDSQYRGP